MIKEILGSLLNLGSELILDKDKKVEHESKIKELELQNQALALNNAKIATNNAKIIELSKDNIQIKTLAMEAEQHILDNRQRLGELDKFIELDTQQNKLNTLQLENEDKFISRARPFSIYALVCAFVSHPLFVLILIIFEFNIDNIKLFIDYSFDALTASVLGILGLGTLRSFDKRQNKVK